MTTITTPTATRELTDRQLSLVASTIALAIELEMTAAANAYDKGATAMAALRDRRVAELRETLAVLEAPVR